MVLLSEFAQGRYVSLQFRQFNLSFTVFEISSKFNSLQRALSYAKWTHKILMAFLTVMFLLLARDMTLTFVDFWAFLIISTLVFSKLIFSPEYSEELSTMFNKVFFEARFLRNAIMSSANISSFFSSLPTIIAWISLLRRTSIARISKQIINK